MKFKKMFLWLLVFPVLVNAQIKGKVVDEKNNPIAYVNIWVESENIGTTANEQGEFTINSTIDKKLIFTAVGFETLTSKISENGIITLKTYIEELEEVVIGNPKGTEEIELGDLKEGNSTFSVGQPFIFAQKIENNDTITKHKFLKELTFLASTSKDSVKMIVHFYKPNKDGFPSSDLLDENLIIYLKKGSEKKNKIDLSSYNIKFPKKGLIIAFEWMIIEENRYFFKDSKNSNFKIYDPTLHFNKQQKYKRFHFNKGKWIKEDDIKFISKSDKIQVRTDLCLKLTLTN